MIMIYFFLGLLFIFSIVSGATVNEKFNKKQTPPTYETKYYQQTLDHFNFGNTQTYKQRYLYNDKNWNTKSYPNGCYGPIFFYTGNESPVTDYWQASGLFTEVLAPKYGALLIFAEHRYFGESLPFGNQSFTNANIGWLSSDQALADYAVLITHLKNTLEGAQNCPVVAFGGSYGGMLSMWFRIKYPNMIIGALAASAPVAFYGAGYSPYVFADACTETFKSAKKGCDTLIGDGMEQMTSLSKTESGRTKISKDFKLCKPLENEEQAQVLIDWAVNGLATGAMLDYPYETDYGVHLNAWTVNNTCDLAMNFPDDSVAAVGAGIGAFYNATGDLTCYDISRDTPDFLGGVAWPYLACTCTYLPAANRGIFPYQNFDVNVDVQNCKSQFGVDLNPSWPYIHWGAVNAVKESSNIILSNGLLDPWHTSGILESLSDSLIAIVIPEAAHHLDLRGPNPKDPIYVQKAREQEDNIIGGWIDDFFKN